ERAMPTLAAAVSGKTMSSEPVSIRTSWVVMPVGPHNRTRITGLGRKDTPPSVGTGLVVGKLFKENITEKSSSQVADTAIEDEANHAFFFVQAEPSHFLVQICFVTRVGEYPRPINRKGDVLLDVRGEFVPGELELRADEFIVIHDGLPRAN